MFGIDDIAMLALAGGSTLGGLFGRKTGNPNEAFADPNNPFYQIATKNYYNNLSKTLSANTPSKATLLAMQAGQGGGYGGSTYIAGKQNENLLTKNRDSAVTASSNFQNNLFQKGMELVAQGNIEDYRTSNSFSDNLLTLGGGLFSRYFNSGLGSGLPTQSAGAGITPKNMVDNKPFAMNPNPLDINETNSMLDFIGYNPMMEYNSLTGSMRGFRY